METKIASPHAALQFNGKPKRNVVYRNQAKQFVLTRQSTSLNLSNSDMKEKFLALSHYGGFSNIDRTNMIESLLGETDEHTEDDKKRNAENRPSPIKRQVDFQQGDESWRRLRRDSQLPDFERVSSSKSRDASSDPRTRFALKRTRSKIFESMDLPGNSFARMATLRANVSAIEKKFRSLVKSKSKRENLVDTKPKRPGEDTSPRPCRFTKPGEALAFFKKCAVSLTNAITWLKYIFTKNHPLNWAKELKSLTDLSEENEHICQPRSLADNGLHFDKTYFKANKEISLSADVRHILSLASGTRTPDMLKQVLHGLQTLDSLCEYPLKTQEGLCKVAWYQRVDAKKIILRQGHHPESFYFILSGTAFVKKMSEDGEQGEETTVARLTRGQSFGEVSLIFDTLRTATVESATPMELLVISKLDFLTIFMNADDPNEEADHIKLLREIPVMKHWPFKALKSEPGACILHYYKRGTLVTENGRSSEWIYFIKSGSCEAIKRLKSVKGRSAIEIKSQTKPENDILPNISVGKTVSSRIDSGKRPRHKSAVNRDVLESMTTFYDHVTKPDSAKVRIPRVQLITPSGCTGMSAVSSPVQSPGRPSFLTHDILLCNLPPVPTSKPHRVPGVSKPRIGKFYLTDSRQSMPGSKSSCARVHIQPDRRAVQVVSSEEDEQVFVKVDVLQERDVFGLQTLESEDDPDFSNEEIPEIALVSRGAEIVLLSKRIFLKYNNDRVKQAMQKTMKRYPKERSLQDILQIEADWGTYRHSVMADTLAHSTTVRSLSAKF